MIARKEWRYLPQYEISDDFLFSIGGNLVLAQALHHLGIHDVGKAAAFLDPAHYSPTSPFELPDMEPTVDRILNAIKRQETIGVWGDFDVDGQTSTTILVDGLRSLGADVVYHIPVRAVESHGVSVPHLLEFLQQGPDLVITCDTGISAFDATAYMKSIGKDFIITDHHALPEQLPDAFSIVSSQLVPIGHPLRTLSGAGVAYKVIEALCTEMNQLEIAHSMLDLVALGLVADVAELVNDTRYLTQLGISALKITKRRGLLEIFRNAAINTHNLNEMNIGFGIAPRLNAIGRLGDANPTVDLLTTQDMATAAVIASQLEGLNDKRKFLTDQVFKGALSQLEKNLDLAASPVIILEQQGWPGGVVGIVASRIVELYGKPAILLSSNDKGITAGSARSIEGIDINAAIKNAASVLLGFGGHPMAAGMSLRTDDLPLFRQLVYAGANEQSRGVSPIPTVEIAAQVPLSELTLPFVRDYEQLAPFGAGNPPLTFKSEELKVVSITEFGKTKEHLLVKAVNGQGQLFDIRWWSGVREFVPKEPFHLAYIARSHIYKDKESIEIEWIDAQPVNPNPVDLTPGKPSIEVYDLRGIHAIDEAMRVINQVTDPLVIAEGVWKDHANITNRNVVNHVNNLILLNAPPTQSTLTTIVNIVKPKTIYMMNLDSNLPITAHEMLKTMAGMLNFAINRREGKFDPQHLAVSLGIPDSLVSLGMQYLDAIGSFRFGMTDDQITAEHFVRELKRLEADELLSRIENELAEIVAFRKFYSFAPISALFPSR